MKKDEIHVFECKSGHALAIKGKSCLICKKCTDIFWDYTNGPYACLCAEGHAGLTQGGRECNIFELDNNVKTLEDFTEELKRKDDEKMIELKGNVYKIYLEQLRMFAKIEKQLKENNNENTRKDDKYVNNN